MSSSRTPGLNALNLSYQKMQLTLGVDPPAKVLHHVGYDAVTQPGGADLGSYPLGNIEVAHFRTEALEAAWLNIAATERSRQVYDAEVALAGSTMTPDRPIVHAVQAAEVLAVHKLTKAMLYVGVAHGWTLRLHASPTSSAIVASWSQEQLLADAVSLAHFARLVSSLVKRKDDTALLTVDIDEASLTGHNVLHPWLHLDTKGPSRAPAFASQEDDDRTMQCVIDVLGHVIDQAHLIPTSATPDGFKLTLASLHHALKQATSSSAACRDMFGALSDQAEGLVGDVDLTMPQHAETLDEDQLDAVISLKLEANDVSTNMLPLGPTLHRMFHRAMWYVCPMTLRPVWMSRKLVPRPVIETWTERPGLLPRLADPKNKLLPATLVNSSWVLHKTMAPPPFKTIVKQRAGKVVMLRYDNVTRTGNKKRKVPEPAGGSRCSRPSSPTRGEQVQRAGARQTGPGGALDYGAYLDDWWVEHGGLYQSDTWTDGCREERRAKIELDGVLSGVPGAPRESEAQFEFLRRWARSANQERRLEFEAHCRERKCSPGRIAGILGVVQRVARDEPEVRRGYLTGEVYYDEEDALKTKRGILTAARYEELCVSLDRTAFFLVLPLMLSKEVGELDALAAELEARRAP